MNQEGFCNKHGPYDAAKGSCPYCEPAQRQAVGRPQSPPSLADEPTDPFGGRRQSPRKTYNNLEETDFPRRRSGYSGGGRGDQFEDLDETDFPRRRRRGDGWEDDEFDVDSTLVDKPARTGLLGWLVVKEGNRRGQFYEIRDEYTVGRKHANVVIRDGKISQPHVKFRIQDDQFVIWDLASRNGTFVNDEQIVSPTPLQENDEIRIGDTTFVLKTLA